MEEKNVRYIRSLAERFGERVGDAMQRSTVVKPADKPCSICGGSGWKQVRTDSTQQVTRCECFYGLQSKSLSNLAEIPSRYLECDFSSYRTGQKQALTEAKFRVEEWAKHYPESRVGLLITGPSGVGKTHLSVAALKSLIRKGIQTRFCDYRELLKKIQNSYNSSVQVTELDILRPIFEADVLLLDDLGAVKPSEWVFDTVSLVLNTRYNENLTTIITTNFMDGPAAGAGGNSGKQENDLTLGDRIGARMRSRLFEMCQLIQIGAEDYRPNFRKAGFR